MFSFFDNWSLLTPTSSQSLIITASVILNAINSIRDKHFTEYQYYLIILNNNL